MKKEVDALRKLRHPRLVRFIGACLQPPLLLVVTERWGWRVIFLAVLVIAMVI
jgi:hypothetical protein